MGETREPTARERRDQHSAETQAVRDVLLFAAVFGGIVLINAVLGLVLIEVFGSLEPQPSGPSGAIAATSRGGPHP
jgi:hypothetical protein